MTENKGYVERGWGERKEDIKKDFLTKQSKNLGSLCIKTPRQ